jgi:hypothetical protein
MTQVKSVYQSAPKTIPVPEELQNQNIEVIFQPLNIVEKKRKLEDFFGSIPDFPERASQGEYEKRNPNWSL